MNSPAGILTSLMPIELVIEGIAGADELAAMAARLGGRGFAGRPTTAAGGKQEKDAETEAENGFLHGLVFLLESGSLRKQSARYVSTQCTQCRWGGQAMAGHAQTTGL